MVLSGLQLSGVLLVTVEFFSVTLVLPVAIPPPLEPVLNRTEVPYGGSQPLRPSGWW
jgi:hypothetical protein